MRLFFTTLLTALILATTSFAAPTAPSRMTLRYGVYSGGFQALDITIDFTLGADRYAANMIAKPHGVLGRLLPWAGTYKTTGTIAKGLLRPTQHEKHSAWRDDTDFTRLTYDKSGRLIRQDQRSVENGKTNIYQKELDPALHRETVDIVTAVLQMLYTASASDSCSTTTTVYDGKRRFAFVFRDKGATTLPASKLNRYQGPARLCEMELVPQAGFTGKPRGYYKIQLDAKAKGELPRVAVGRFKPADPYAVPLRLTLKSEYGTIFVHLVHKR